MRKRIWNDVLSELAKRNPVAFTAGDVADESGLSYGAAAQLLERLRSWGHIRHVGFEDPEGGRGRRRKVFEVSEHGRRRAAWYAKNGGKR